MDTDGLALRLGVAWASLRCPIFGLKDKTGAQGIGDGDTFVK